MTTTDPFNFNTAQSPTKSRGLRLEFSIQKGLLWGAFFLCFLIIIPILLVPAQFTKSSEGLWQHFADTILVELLLNSLFLMVGTAFFVTLFGTISAWCIVMYRFPGSRFFEWGLILPLAFPAYVLAYLYTDFFQVSGPVQTLIRDFFDWKIGEYFFPNIRSIGGVIAIFSVIFYPYVYLLARAAFLEQSLCSLEASRMLGASPFRTFYKVALPMARPSIIAGILLCLMEVLADYGAVSYFALPTFTTAIFKAWFSMNSLAGAAQLASLLLFLILGLFFLEQWAQGRAQYYAISQRRLPIPLKKLSPLPAFAASFFCGFLCVFGFFLPAFLLLEMSLFQTAPQLTDDYLQIIQNTLLLACLGALLCIFCALWISWAKRLCKNKTLNLLSQIAALGYAIPGMVLAIGVHLFISPIDAALNKLFANFDSYQPTLYLSGSIAILLLAMLARFLTLGLKSLSVGLDRITPSMEEVAQNLGASPQRTLRSIHLRIMQPSVLTAFLLIFVEIVKELPATLMLRPFNFDTLAIRTYQLASDERLAESAHYALAIVCCSLIPLYFLSRQIQKSRHTTPLKDKRL